ncbi:MAG: phenylalanine--tRNA ligase subunit alpha [Candidatus Micrarchaeia archaeon]
MELNLHQLEKKLLPSLSRSEEPLRAAAEKAGMGVDEANRAAAWLEEKGLAKVSRESKTEITLTQEGEEYLKNGFPEASVARKAAAGAKIAELGQKEKSIGMAWARKLGWVDIEAGALKLTPKGREGIEKDTARKAAQAIKSGAHADNESVSMLVSRGLAQKTEQKELAISITDKGAKVVKEGITDAPGEINLLDRNTIASGAWKGRPIRRYDVSQEVDMEPAGKRHMAMAFRERIRGIFAQMGFEEMEGSIVESSFWNFDALFQPQDHPARELADTFYLDLKTQLPKDAALVKAVAKSHEDGWKYVWSEKEATKGVLRTHTTAVSARYIAKSAKLGKKKYFSVGKVFRKEATDYKHLAEFFQVEGIVIDEKATISDLLGILTEFYSKIGFDNIRFRPSFFPYTEPSLEIEVYFKERNAWLELGGAGIMRPEVSIPLCGRYPVLAWGVSLERPLMLLHDIKDIRTFYQNNIGWLRQNRIGDKQDRVKA